jgi:hypothetical protein
MSLLNDKVVHLEGMAHGGKWWKGLPAKNQLAISLWAKIASQWEYGYPSVKKEKCLFLSFLNLWWAHGSSEKYHSERPTLSLGSFSLCFLICKMGSMNLSAKWLVISVGERSVLSQHQSQVSELRFCD